MSLSVLIDRMISAGVPPAEAGAIAAEIYAAGVASVTGKSSNAARQQRYRDRNKSVTERNETVTALRPDDASPTVTNRNESVTNRNGVTLCENASLSKKERKEEEKEESKGASRGARLPVGWTPTPQDWAVSCELLSEKRAKLELDKFTDHWKQQPGSRGVKLDWNAAWRNWTRRAAEYGAQKNGRRTVHDAARDFHENLLDRIAAFDEPAPSSLCGGEGAGVVRLLPPRRRE